MDEAPKKRESRFVRFLQPHASCGVGKQTMTDAIKQGLMNVVLGLGALAIGFALLLVVWTVA